MDRAVAMDTWLLRNLLERERMLQLHDWFFPFFLIAAAGSVIQQLHKKNESWTKKQF
jgi:hypothetical protein